VALGAAALLFSEWLIVRFERTRASRYLPMISVACAAAVVLAAAFQSRQLAEVAPFFLLAYGTYVAGARRGESTREGRVTDEAGSTGRAALVLIAATLSLAWATWLVGAPRGWGRG